MAGYSATPLARKLGAKPGLEVVLRHAPGGWGIEGVAASDVGFEQADVVVAFYRSRAELSADVAVVPGALGKAASWWIAWPRKAGGHVSDITENLLRELVLPTGLVDVKVAALDEDWSGLKFVWRKENR
ncbi:hypothetical protein Rhe02_21450 [Rhizocola hellebori]|uniref:DUF3052 domain-containing protein n=1 Tax=Rhizocola hellebori TaxID=1392758 RepID=A0A8J3VFP2_9ACTN|nr:DUF3052 domain-containing protein [Rhizocola hellebori]GIH04078.1 hypothetical protein Rhe02_21450 [Rhizocola hellebori]